MNFPYKPRSSDPNKTLFPRLMMLDARVGRKTLVSGRKLFYSMAIIGNPHEEHLQA
jgi:hypothetical protein